MASAAAKKGKKELKKLKIGKKKVLDFAGRHLVGEGIKEMNVADERAKEEVIVKAKTADVNLEGRIIASFSTGNGLEAQAMVQYYATPHAVSAQATPMPEIITQVQVIPFANSLAYAFVAPALQMHNLTADNALHMLPVKSETGFVAFSYNTSTIMYTAYEGAVSSTDNIEYTSIDYTPMLEYQVLTHGEPLGQYLASTMDKPMMMSQVYLKEDTSEQVSVRADIKIQYDAKQLTDLLEDVKTDSKIESIVQEYVVFVPQMMVRSYDNIETTINTETYQDVKVDHESVIPIMEKVDYVPQQQVDLQLVEMVMPDIKVDYKEDNLVREETIQQEDYTNLEQAIEEVNIEYQTAELPANNVIDLSEYREKTSTEYTAKEETKIEVKTDSENSDLSHVNTESTTNTMDISREMTTLDNKVDEETEEKTVAKSDDKDYRPIETKKREYEDPKVIPFKPRDSYEKKIELPELRVQEKKEYNLEKKVLKQQCHLNQNDPYLQKAKEYAAERRKNKKPCKGSMRQYFHHNSNYRLQKMVIENEEVPHMYKVTDFRVNSEDLKGGKEIEVYNHKTGEYETHVTEDGEMLGAIVNNLEKRGIKPIVEDMYYIDTRTGEEKHDLIVTAAAQYHVEAKKKLGRDIGVEFIVDGKINNYSSISSAKLNAGSKISVVYKNTNAWHDALTPQEHKKAA